MFMLKKYTQILLSQQAKRVGGMIIICLLSHPSHFFAMDNNGLGTKAIAMANAFVAISDNCWAVHYNPAGLVKVTDCQCSACIIPAQFGLQELKTSALGAALPFPLVSTGVEAVKFGYDLYSEMELEIALAKKIDKIFSAGLSFEYYRIDIARYGTAGSFIINGGFMTQVADGVEIGFSVHNLIGAIVGKTDEKLPQVINLGACWLLYTDLHISMEMEKDIRFPASIKMGIEQIVISAIAIRAGVANNPDKYSFGLGIRYSSFEFGYAGYSHPDLGWTHQVDLTFNFGK
jgi:hypothetical protein